MPRIPEKIRTTLEKIVKEMRTKENVYGIGLFGSWSRGDASPTSDIDLLIFDVGDFGYEYVERFETAGLLLDLDRVPKKWIQGPIPPEMDQKIYEMQILYDRDWSMANTKLLMTRSYGSPERVDIRTEAHIIDSDIYLSRATSAFSRADFASAHLFATAALEDILKVLIEVAMKPFSNSHFIETLEISATKLERRELFDEYLEVTGLDKVDAEDVKGNLQLFKIVWDEINGAVDDDPRMLESAHFRVKTALKYYLNPAFLRGAIIRASAMFDSGRLVETSHYLRNILLSILENYVWLKTSKDRLAIDYTTLLRSFESLEANNPKNRRDVIEFLGLNGIDKTASSKTIEKTREIMLAIRRQRKVLIKNNLCKNSSVHSNARSPVV